MKFILRYALLVMLLLPAVSCEPKDKSKAESDSEHVDVSYIFTFPKMENIQKHRVDTAKSRGMIYFDGIKSTEDDKTIITGDYLVIFENSLFGVDDVAGGSADRSLYECAHKAGRVIMDSNGDIIKIDGGKGFAIKEVNAFGVRLWEVSEHLKLTFNGISDEYIQGDITISYILENASKENVNIRGWRSEGEITNITFVYRLKNSTDEYRELPSRPLLSNVSIGSSKIIKPAERLKISSTYILNVQPGEYEVAAHVSQELSVQTQKRNIMVKHSDKKIDMRK